MYLYTSELIFNSQFLVCVAGAEDIRMQLPEEAKKFDAIDRTFKNIMTATR